MVVQLDHAVRRVEGYTKMVWLWQDKEAFCGLGKCLHTAMDSWREARPPSGRHPWGSPKVMLACTLIEVLIEIWAGVDAGVVGLLVGETSFCGLGRWVRGIALVLNLDDDSDSKFGSTASRA